MDSSDAARKFEKFVFHGVPEKPEPTFERDDYSQYTERQTGRTLNGAVDRVAKGEWVVVGKVVVDLVSETEEFVRVESST